MNWATITWSAGAGVCMALAGVHLLVWAKSPKAWANLFFVIAAVSAAATAMVELNLMHAPTPEAYGELVHWKYLSIGILTISLVWFIHFYLRGGSVWLVWLFCAWRGLTQILDLLVEQGIYFREITGLRPIPFLDEIVVLPIGVVSPWAHFANASNLVLIMIALDGGIAVWRQGNRRRAAVVPSTIIGAVVLGMVQLFIMERGVLPMPHTVSMVFLIIVLGMAYELSVDMINAGQLSRELHQSRERMRLAAHAANFGLWEWDVVRDELWANDVTRARFGAQDGERLDFERFLQSVHPEDRETTRRAIGQALDRAGEFTVEYRMVVPDSNVRWIAAIGQVERGLNHKPLRLSGVSIDITKRRLSEDALRRSEQLARILLNTTSAMTHLIDVEGTIIDLNDAMANTLGGTREELIGTNVFDRFPHEVAERRRETIRHAANEQKVMRFEDTDSGGNNKVFDTFIYPVQPPPGANQQLVIFIHDITDRKRTEQRLEDNQRRLKALASQLTLAEERTRQKIAADLHDNIGHSLALARIQLSGILESTSGLETSILVKDISAILMKALQDTRQLIFDLGARSLKEFGLGQAISEWLEENIGGRHRLKTDFVNTLPEKYEERMGEDIKVLLFRNIRELLTNVVKHARASMVMVGLSCDEQNFILSVEDDGIGFTYGESDKAVNSKNGFGLLSIRTRMINMGGTFDIHSEPGKGCRIVLTVPATPLNELRP